MASLGTVVLFWLIELSWGSNLDFPPGFKFGVSTAAYQIEGGWNVSDKGESIWDRFVHTHLEKYNGEDGDVACDSYHNWKRDIEMVSELGVDFYRFSISWSRILPTGFTNHISEDGVNYYRNLIDGLLAEGIEPLVTMYHWDLPQNLQNFGGWLNPLISDWFADYAKVLYNLYGDRVKTWITFNEPIAVCDLPYNFGSIAPGILEPEFSPLICSKHVIMAHAKAWRLYEKEYKHQYHGRMSINNNVIWFEGLTEEDNDLADLAMCYALRYEYPIFSATGGWPPAVEAVIAENTNKKGFPWPRLPKFTKQEIEFVKGTYDYYAINHYLSRVVQKARSGDKLHPFPLGDVPELNLTLGTRKSWGDKDTIFSTYPEGLRKSLSWIKKTYGDLDIVIIESGFPDIYGLNDVVRIDYMKKSLQQVLLAIQEDGVNVTGFSFWSLMDNFEWIGDGYKSKFGLYQVDFSAADRARTPRKSAHYYKSVVRARSLAVPAEPLGWIDTQLRSGASATSTYTTLFIRVYFCVLLGVIFSLRC